MNGIFEIWAATKNFGEFIPWHHCRCFFTQGGNVDQHSYLSFKILS